MKTPASPLLWTQSQAIEDLAIALITWLGALGCAYAAVTDGTVDAALHHLLPDHPHF